MTQSPSARGMGRRDFLKSVASAAIGVPLWLTLSSRAAWAKLPAGIKITKLKTFVVGNLVFVKVYTSEGVTGVGEGSFGGRALTAAAAIDEHQRLLIGKDPTEIELLYQQMFRWPRTRGGPMVHCAISAIDIALWDILGKLLDVPIYKLLGGAVRKRVRLYAHVQATTTEEIAERVGKVKEEGFTAVRSGLAFQRGNVVRRPWDLKHAVSLIQAMRDAAGKDVDLIDDAHGLLTPVMVREYAKAIEPCRLMFLEDPVQPENIDGLKDLAKHTSVPLAIGESMYGKFQFKDVIARRLVSYVRPDPIRAGGITECRKVAAMAEGNFIDVSLHVAPSPVSNLAAVHIAAAAPNCVIVENSGRPGLRPKWVEDLFMGGGIKIVDGYAALPEAAGLGCDLDEKVAAEHPYRPRDLPRIEYEDGSPSNW